MELEIKKELERVLKRNIELEVPQNSALGDYAFPCFSLSKEFKKNPKDIAIELAGQIRGDFRVEANNGYVNFFVNKNKLIKEVLAKILKEKNKYGGSDAGKGKVVIIDMSSPNIAKPFGIGHLRSTIIGDAIRNLYVFLGYKVVRINYLGDWGTQFGKLIFAYKKWGDKKQLVKDPIRYLLKLYVKSNKEEYENDGREWFKELENGNKEALSLWKQFRILSLKEFKKIYKILNVKFESYHGEAFYNDKLDDVVNLLQKKELLIESEGALIVDLKKYGMPPLLIQKSDGTTLYATRDIAAVLYRKAKYDFNKAFYEVGSEQKLYFRQLFKVLELIGFAWAKDCVHVDHGLYLGEDGRKFSTREGKVVFMDDILQDGIAKARKTIEEKNPRLKDKKNTAQKIAVGAIKYGDLKNDRVKDVIFNWEKFLDFNGETGPYIQYAHVRACGVLRKGRLKRNIDYLSLKDDCELELVKHLRVFSMIVKKTAEEYKPHIVAKYVYELACLFNDFYEKVPILKADDNIRNARLSLVFCVREVLKNGLKLLGIEAPDKM